MLIKGTKISQLKQRDKLTGGEFIPFQEKWSNGKLNMKAIINHFSDVTDQNISLQSLVNIKQFINNESELDSMTSEPWDVYYSRQDKKLYMYSYNEDTQEGSYEASEPTSNQLYVMLTPLDEEKSNAVYRWDKDTKQFVAPSYVDDVVDVYAVYTASPIGELSNIHLYSDKDRTTPILGETGKLYINKNAGEPEHLFRWNGTEYSQITDGGPLIIGEIENTAYDGAKGKHNADVLNSLPDTIIYAVQDYTNDASQVKLNYSFKRKKEDGTFANATNASKTLPTASKTEAGVMTAADKVKLDETLPNAIDKEIQDRIDAIDALDSKTTAAINKEISDRTAADTALDNKINKEISDRTTAIDALSNTVNSNYTTLDNKIIAETTRATNAESTLQSNLDVESQARQTADTQLSNKIDSLEQSTGQITDTLQTALNQEITRATTAESTLQSNIDTINNSKGVANGIATLNEQGLVPASQLPSYVDDVVEVYATYDTSDTGQLSNIQLYTDAEHTDTVVAESGKIYVNVTADQPSYQFRWSGNEYIHITSGSLILGEITGTAYDGGKGKATTDLINTLPNIIVSGVNRVEQNEIYDTINFRAHYKRSGKYKEEYFVIMIPTVSSRLAGVMSAEDKRKLDALKTQSEITADIDAVQDNLTTHINNKTNPHEVTKAQIGLGNVDNTSDLDKPISTAVQAALDAIPSNIPDEVVDQVDITRDDVMDTNTEKLFLYRHKTDIATGQGIGDYIEIPSASTTKDGLLTHTDKSKIDKISVTGDGTKYLSDDGTYKTIESGGADKEEVYTFRNSIDGEISQDEFNSIKQAIQQEKLIMVPLMFAFAGSNQGPLVPTNCYSDDNGITMHHVIAAMNGEAQIANIHISNDLTITTDNIDTLSRNEVLTKTNINAYTPTKEYHPATKQYVDDTVTTAQNNVVTLDTSQVITGRKQFESGIYVEGHANGNYDDEGIVVGRASNNYAALTLGDPLGIHSTFYLHPGNIATWRYNNGSVNFDIEHPYKNGTIALTSDLSDLQNTISSLQSQIASLESQLSSKASQSSLDSVSGRVSTIESQYVKSDNIRNITKKTSSEYASITKDANTMYAVVD